MMVDNSKPHLRLPHQRTTFTLLNNFAPNKKPTIASAISTIILKLCASLLGIRCKTEGPKIKPNRINKVTRGRCALRPTNSINKLTIKITPNEIKTTALVNIISNSL